MIAVISAAASTPHSAPLRFFILRRIAQSLRLSNATKDVTHLEEHIVFHSNFSGASLTPVPMGAPILSRICCCLCRQKGPMAYAYCMTAPHPVQAKIKSFLAARWKTPFGVREPCSRLNADSTSHPNDLAGALLPPTPNSET
jgi:hypothetical protein